MARSQGARSDEGYLFPPSKQVLWRIEYRSVGRRIMRDTGLPLLRRIAFVFSSAAFFLFIFDGVAKTHQSRALPLTLFA
jgi:hypothetical protein